MKKALFVSLFCIIASTVSASAEVVPGPNGSGVQVYKPDDFKFEAAEKGGEAVMVAVSPKEDAMFVWAVTGAENLEAALQGVEGLLAPHIKDAKITKQSKSKLSGMPALILEATATRVTNGKPVKAGLVIAQTPTKKVLIAVGLFEAAQEKAYAATVKKVLAGIKPAK